MHDKQTIKVVYLGSIVGKTGQLMYARHADYIKQHYNPDFIIAHGGISAVDGIGITAEDAAFLHSYSIDILTTGPEVWHHKNIEPILNSSTHIIRPINFSFSSVGSGIALLYKNNIICAFIVCLGRSFMPVVSDCPFVATEKILNELTNKTKLIFVEMHAQTTSEKVTFGHFLDGKVTAVVGSQTRVLTNDIKILPKKTAFMCDLGMVGSKNSILGFEKQTLEQYYKKYTKVVEKNPPYILTGSFITADVKTGKALSIEHICIHDTQDLFA